MTIITSKSTGAKQDRGPIYFYNVGEPYYEFTNFYKGNDILIDGKQ